VPRAAVDIGSNTILLLVIDDHGLPIHDEAVVVGLGRGLGDKGMFRPDRMDDAVQTLARFAEQASALGVPAFEVRVAATSAARRALNARTFVDRVYQETGLRIDIVSGAEEARLTWRGALLDLPLPNAPIGVVDLGGGSTELVLGQGEQMGPRQSLELGSVRLTEAFFGDGGGRYRPTDLARCKAHIQSVTESFRWSLMPKALVAVAGTATTLGAMELGLTAWDSARVHGARLTRAALRSWTDRLFASSPEERRQLAQVSPERANYLLAGACVLEAVCTHAHRDSLWLSIGGVRHGLLAD
jgi:exopolyphosphatase/guanosine-5'-triphosphate,3'-diphosphate pyrophosphatase